MLADPLPLETRRHYLLDRHRLGRSQGLGHIIRLAVDLLFETGTAVEVGAAGIQQLGEAIRPAPGIRLVEYLQQGRWLEIEGDVDMGVQVAHQQRQITAVVRHSEPLAEIPDER